MSNSPQNEADIYEQWKREILDLVIKLLKKAKWAGYAQGYDEGLKIAGEIEQDIRSGI